MKTTELQGAALDWAVAQLEGYKYDDFDAEDMVYRDEDNCWYQPSEDWSQGGPIIERERIRISDEPFSDKGECFIDEGGKGHWYAAHSTWSFTNVRGETPLIAAMRCYVASKMGDEIELPEDLR